LDWHLLEDPGHAGIQSLVRDLNSVLRAERALWELDFESDGFWWLEPNDADNNVFAFARAGRGGDPVVVCAMNLAPVPRENYRLGLPRAGHWNEILNTDAELYGGTNTGNLGGVETEDVPWHNQQQSAEITLPPLGVLYLTPGGVRPT
jgi:1,4-alpha-glucan branching enzyme